MCGLAGVVFAPRPSPDGQEESLRRLRHRGPDGARAWSDGSAWLGHTRLRILDTSEAGDQPMVDRLGRGVLVYNGEVYNYRDLEGELGSSLRRTSHADTDVVLEMLARDGAKALRRFNGMWALAFWQPRERRLLLARDRFGVKPLYYANIPGGGIAFASEIAALLALTGCSGEPEPEVVQRFALFGEAEPREQTFFKGVRKLPAGCFAVVTSDGFRLESYWDLREAAAAEPLPVDPAAEYARRFRDAVRLRLRSDVPVGTCLSGGLDSSSIVCVVQDLADKGQVEPTLTYAAFSARHPGTTSDEGPFIQAVLGHTSFKGHDVVPRPENIAAEIESVVRHQGEPFGSLAVYSQWCVMRLARERGVTVLLDGQGADEVLAGYPMHAHYRLGDLGRQGRWRSALQMAQSLKAIQGLSLRSSLTSLVGGIAPRWLKDLRGVGISRRSRQLFTEDLLRGVAAAPRLPGPFGDGLTDTLYASVVNQGLPSLLRYEDRNSMAFSVEARVPFLDWRLVSLAFRLPPEWKIHDGWSKWVLRQAMEPHLPGIVRWRRDKKAFATPQAEWLQGPLREWVRDLLHSQTFRERGWFEQRAVESAYARWLQGGESLSAELWRILSLELWMRSLPKGARG